MLKLAGLAIAALAAVLIVAVGYWSHRGRNETHFEEPGFEEQAEHHMPDQRPSRAIRTAGVSTGQGARTYRQGEDVAKSKSRLGLGERMGWLKRADRDAEMWPEESFGGVSDEQFWDDMSSDKPLATTARTAQPEGEPRRRPMEVHSAPPPKATPPKATPPKAMPPKAAPFKPMPAKAATATTQSFPVTAMPLAAGAPTGPQPVRTGPQPVRPVQTGPQPVLTGPQSVLTGPQPVLTGPQPVRSQPAQGLPHRAAASAPPPAAPPAPVQQPSRGRHSNGEDPLTSDAFSLRSSTDGRSYRSSRRSSSGLSPDQYNAALSQETQTFSLADSPSGGYPAQQYEPPQPARRYPDDRTSGSYPAQPRPPESHSYPSPSYGQPAPATPYSDSYDYRDDDSRRPVPSRESAARESAVAGRPPRPVYATGSHRSPYDPRGGERR